MTSLSSFMPALPAPFVPREHTTPTLPARLEAMPHGAARVTIGEISSPWANAGAAQDQLNAMAARGLVRIEGKEPPC